MSRRILIVDDEFGLAEVVAEMLQEAGYQVTLAINGQLALERMIERTPDVLLLDFMMPILDGAEVVRAMREQPKIADVPVILMTALPQAVPAETVGAVRTVLRKPFTPTELFDAIARCLRSS